MSNTVTTLDKKAIRKEILVLIVPIILEGIFGYLAGIVSSALVGRLSALAISSQGVVFRITDLLAVFWGSIRIGAMVYFVKLYGEGKYREIIQAFKNICTVTLGIGFICMAVLVFFPMPILSFFTKDAEILASARTYMNIVMVGLPFFIMMKMNASLFYSVGDTKTPMYIQIAVNIINIVLGYLFIFVLNWDLIGAGWATVSSQIVGGVSGLYMLSRKPVFKKIGITSWKIENTEPIKVTFKKAIPIALESGFWQMSAIVMTKVILVFGTDAYAGYSLASSAETLTELPVIGFTVAATTLAGKALGEKNGPLFREYYRQQMWMNSIISGIGSAVMIFLPSVFMSIVTDNPALKEIGTVYLIIMGLILIPQNVQRTQKGMLYGLGNTKVPMYISGFGIWIIRIPLASLAAWVFHWPLVTIWIIIAADQVIRYLLMHFYIKHINALYCVEEQEKKELEASKA